MRGTILNYEIFTNSSIKRLNCSLFSFIIHFIWRKKNNQKLSMVNKNTFFFFHFLGTVYLVCSFMHVSHCKVKFIRGLSSIFCLSNTTHKKWKKKSFPNENKISYLSILYISFLHTAYGSPVSWLLQRKYFHAATK